MFMTQRLEYIDQLKGLAMLCQHPYKALYKK